MGCQLRRFQRGSWELPPPGRWGLCGNIRGARRVHLLKPPTPTSQMGPCDSGSARQEGTASRCGLCPACSPCAPQAHLRPCRAEPQRVWPSALATAAPALRVAPASRKALKSCDHPPASRRAVCLGPGPAVLWGPWEEPHPTPQPGSGQRDRLLAKLDTVRLTVCSQQHRGEACSACQEGSGFNPPFQEALCSSSHHPQSRNPRAMWRGVDRCPRGVPSSRAAASQDG